MTLWGATLPRTYMCPFGEGLAELRRCDLATVRFHNFKSPNFKLRVSNPKNTYIACLSVLSRISNCQGLGRKNKFEILKTYRICVPLDYWRVTFDSMLLESMESIWRVTFVLCNFYTVESICVTCLLSM